VSEIIATYSHIANGVTRGLSQEVQNLTAGSPLATVWRPPATTQENNVQKR